ncbi:MAG: pyruvate kinase [Rhodoferax sp.]|jgi:pyruvate kinase|nr:pyruvate kinase [Rhodoferax sp.]MBP9684613.1 pyruvate kinase [Rhodoferax sp.]
MRKSPKTHSILNLKEEASTWDSEVCHAIIAQLWQLRNAMLAREAAMREELSLVSPENRESARNLIHYLTLRSSDLREVQEKLTWLGLSSLGRSESHVLANLDKVLGILHRLTGQDWQDKSADEPAGMVSSHHLLARHTSDLLGTARPERPVRIMVTLPSEAATDFSVVRELVQAGMDIARINCAHDGADQWKAMASNVRRAAKSASREVRILMDLGGPKIRTGDIPPRPAVLKLRPHRDDYGHVLQPASLGLRSIDESNELMDADCCVGVEHEWLANLKVGTSITFSDARHAKRRLVVVSVDERGAIAHCLKTAYLTPNSCLTIEDADHEVEASSSLVHGIEYLPGLLHLHRGDALYLTRGQLEPLPPGKPDEETDVRAPARIACTLPQVIDQVNPGERIWFDDGRIGGLIRRVTPDWLEIEITQAREGGEKLIGDKGINLPDSALNLPALTDKDIADLVVVASEADMVGLSFVQKPEDVMLLREHLHRHGKDDIGIVLKIETLQGFENLPELMLAAMAGKSAGVMIARGDLAVECGYERLAEVQEEILWCAEAAHMPVIWATQVLETLAKTGVPSRAEISDAGMGVRAECVMLNKGPYITDAIRALDDILRRMAGHQAKKRPLLRALRAWSGAGAASATPSSAANTSATTSADELALS